MREPTVENLIEQAGRMALALKTACDVLGPIGARGNDEAWGAFSQCLAALTWFQGTDAKKKEQTP